MPPSRLTSGVGRYETSPLEKPSTNVFCPRASRSTSPVSDIKNTKHAAHEPLISRGAPCGRPIGRAIHSKAVGISQSTLSAILNGEREMTKSHMVALAKFFNVPPAVFLPS